MVSCFSFQIKRRILSTLRENPQTSVELWLTFFTWCVSPIVSSCREANQLRHVSNIYGGTCLFCALDARYITLSQKYPVLIFEQLNFWNYFSQLREHFRNSFRGIMWHTWVKLFIWNVASSPGKPIGKWSGICMARSFSCKEMQDLKLLLGNPRSCVFKMWRKRMLAIFNVLLLTRMDV